MVIPSASRKPALPTTRRWLIGPLVIAAAVAWAALPAFAAAGLGLDHPAWSSPDVDPPAGPLAADDSSWWPPGHRYRWTGRTTGEPIERIDPWGPPLGGHAWTAGIATATGLTAWWLWRGGRPLAERLHIRRRPDFHRWELII